LAESRYIFPIEVKAKFFRIERNRAADIFDLISNTPDTRNDRRSGVRRTGCAFCLLSIHGSSLLVFFCFELHEWFPSRLCSITASAVDTRESLSPARQGVVIPAC